MSAASLTVAIPTFNRADKLKRLLAFFVQEMAHKDAPKGINFLVSDNASQDVTEAAASDFRFSLPEFSYHRQDCNLGFDGNVFFLYKMSFGRHVWFIADDDVPFVGAIEKITVALEKYDPDVLLFSFVQPPGSCVRTFNFEQSVELITDPSIAIQHLMLCPKLSIYVLKKLCFSDDEWNECRRCAHLGWAHVALALAVLAHSPAVRLAVISEPLARSDDDYQRLPWTPEVFLYLHRPMEHPFVKTHCPYLTVKYQNLGYSQAIIFSFSAKTGGLKPLHPEDYDEFIRRLEFRLVFLLKNPKVLVMLILLKLGLAECWPRLRPLCRMLRK